jgi:hypothetical protein
LARANAEWGALPEQRPSKTICAQQILKLFLFFSIPSIQNKVSATTPIDAPTRELELTKSQMMKAKVFI